MTPNPTPTLAHSSRTLGRVGLGTLAQALGVALVFGMFQSCTCAADRGACTRDGDCGDGSVCYLDGLCVPRHVAERAGADVGDECVVSGGHEFGCSGEEICRLGRCSAASSMATDGGGHTHDGGPPADGEVALDGPFVPGDGAIPLDGATDLACTVTSAPDDFVPLFGGVTEAFADGPDAVGLSWFPAADETLPDAMTYLVFVSTVPGVYDLTTPAAEVTGVTTYRMTGLVTGSTYYFLVRARDALGQIDCNTNERSATPQLPSDCVDFDSEIQTIFNSRCITCHGGATPERNLSLESYAGVMAGGLTGFEVTPCQAESSLIYLKISSSTPPVGERMPRGGPYLSAAQIDTFRRWIAQGAPRSCPVDPALCGDTTAPSFAGISTATLEGSAGARLCWSAGTDDTTAPAMLSYDVYQATAMGAEDFTRLPTTASTPGATCTSITGLTPGSRYCWVVRARDAAGNRDANTVERCVDVPAALCIDYATVIQPIFNANCIRCHSGALAPRGLHLDTRAGVLAGGATGGEVLACNAAGSLLVQKISLDRPPVGARMPLDGPPYLSAPQIAAISQWISEGARAACGGPDPCSDAVAPTFAGLTSATALDATRARLCWAAGADDTTPAADLVYSVYEGTAAGREDFARARALTAAGELCTTVDALSPGGTYCWVARASDAASNQDTNTVERCVTMPTLPAGCVDYATMIQPLLARNCTRCHSGAAPPQWLRLDTYENVLAGSVRRNEVSACDAAGSLLLSKVSATPSIGARMPFDGPPYLTAPQIAMLTQWVTDGARRSCAEPSSCGDTARPVFAGATSATVTDATTVRVCWGAATDDLTSPSSMRYEVYESTTRGGERYAEAAALAVTGATCVDVPVGPGQNVCFVVRARDVAGNRDANTTEVCAAPPPVACAVGYAELVQPILSARCTHCHRNDVSAPRFLDLRSYGGVIAGGAIRNEARACDWATSLLNTKTSGDTCGRRMPADGPPWLSPAERSILQAWVASGARLRCSEPEPCADAVAPTFGGITRVTEIDPSTLEVCWDAALDDTSASTGIRYEVFDSPTPGGEDLTRRAPYAIAGGATCMRIRVPSGQQTCFVVRARDLRGNTDTNTSELCRTTAGGCFAYDDVVQPVLSARCVHCHSGPSAPRGIRWDTYANAIADPGEVRPCRAGSSNMIDFTERCAMPQDTTSGACRACLTSTQIRLFSEWIDQGATRSCPWGACP